MMLLNTVENTISACFSTDLVKGIHRGIIEADIHRKIYVHGHARRGIDPVHFYDYVQKYIVKAVEYYRMGKHYEAGRLLGIAIHIAQDLALLKGSHGWHNIMEKDIEKTLSSLDRNFIYNCINLSDVRLYTISAENIVCIAYALTEKTIESFYEELKHIEDSTIKSLRLLHRHRKGNKMS